MSRGGEFSAAIEFDPHVEQDLNRLIGAWLPLTFAVNSLNRSMGQPDLYPFVLSPAVVTKLGFVHRLIRSAGDAAGRGAGGHANYHDQLAPA